MASKTFPYRAAMVACNGGCRANTSPEYKCVYGCTGCEQCILACPFGAISMGGLGVAEIDPVRCTACGKCAAFCPQNLIRIQPCANFISVRCANRDPGKLARQVCSVSCIGCGLCEKLCSANAIHVEHNLAVINPDKCLSCGVCAVNCPRGAILDSRGILTPLR